MSRQREAAPLLWNDRPVFSHPLKTSKANHFLLTWAKRGCTEALDLWLSLQLINSDMPSLFTPLWHWIYFTKSHRWCLGRRRAKHLYHQKKAFSVCFFASSFNKQMPSNSYQTATSCTCASLFTGCHCLLACGHFSQTTLITTASFRSGRSLTRNTCLLDSQAFILRARSVQMP